LRSFRLNFEVHTLVHDQATAAKLRATFEADREKCRRLDFDEWESRGWLLRVKEGIARLASPLL